MSEFSRTERVIGKAAVAKLKKSCVCIFGIGGVGGYIAETLARAGIGTLHLIDNDSVSITNLNRQIIALHSTAGKSKVQAMAERVHDICPGTKVECHELFFLPGTPEGRDLFSTKFDYVADAVDTVSAKLAIAETCDSLKIPLISAMGAGNKLDPTKLRTADIYKTSGDPLARVMRRECRKRGIKKLKVVYSTEEPIYSTDFEDNESIPDGSSRHTLPGSMVFVPAAMGIIMASEIVKQIISGNSEEKTDEIN